MNCKLPLLVAAIVVLGGCTAAPQQQKPAHSSRVEDFGSDYTFLVTPGMSGAFPANYKSVVAAWVRASFLDPFSLRNVAITNPVEAKAGKFGWLVCFSANGRNTFGAYAGQQTYAVLINNGTVVDAFPKTRMRGASGASAGYQRTANTLNEMEGSLALDLCGRGLQSGKMSFEPFPELEAR